MSDQMNGEKEDHEKEGGEGLSEAFQRYREETDEVARDVRFGRALEDREEEDGKPESIEDRVCRWLNEETPEETAAEVGED